MTQQLRIATPPDGEVYTFESLEAAVGAVRTYERAYIPASQALIDIHSDGLWEEGGFESYEDFLARGADMSPSRASQLESAGRFVRFLGINYPDERAPSNERIVRAIMRIKRKKNHEPPYDFLETEEAVMERRCVAWREIQDTAKSNQEPITAEFAGAIVDKSYRGGTKVGKTKLYKLEDLENACALLLEIEKQHPASEAREEWGDPRDWAYFDDAVEYLEALAGL